MTDHFNGLTPAEAERLAMLAEECGEIVQAVGKTLRHGYESRHPARPEDGDNRDLLRRELDDLLGVLRLMQMNGDFPVRQEDTEDRLIRAARNKKLRYAHHQDVTP